MTSATETNTYQAFQGLFITASNLFTVQWQCLEQRPSTQLIKQCRPQRNGSLNLL